MESKDNTEDLGLKLSEKAVELEKICEKIFLGIVQLKIRFQKFYKRVMSYRGVIIFADIIQIKVDKIGEEIILDIAKYNLVKYGME